MLTEPQILTTRAEPAAVIRLTIPREQIQQLMGPAIHEVIAAVAAQGIGPAGPVFSRHFCVDPAIFDFEVGVPVSGPVQPSGRVHASELPAAKVIRTVYQGPYENLGPAWGEFTAQIERMEEIKAASGFWERYVYGPESSPDPAQWRTELNRVLA